MEGKAGSTICCHSRHFESCCRGIDQERLLNPPLKSYSLLPGVLSWVRSLTRAPAGCGLPCRLLWCTGNVHQPNGRHMLHCRFHGDAVRAVFQRPRHVAEQASTDVSRLHSIPCRAGGADTGERGVCTCACLSIRQCSPPACHAISSRCTTATCGH